MAALPPQRELKTNVLGMDLAFPVIVFPTGAQAIDPGGEVAVAADWHPDQAERLREPAVRARSCGEPERASKLMFRNPVASDTELSVDLGNSAGGACLCDRPKCIAWLLRRYTSLQRTTTPVRSTAVAVRFALLLILLPPSFLPSYRMLFCGSRHFSPKAPRR